MKTICLIVMMLFVTELAQAEIVVSISPGINGRTQIGFSWPKSTDRNVVKYRFRCSTINKAPMPVYTDTPENVLISEDFALIMKLAPTPTFCCISAINNMGLESACSTPVIELPAYLPPAPIL